MGNYAQNLYNFFKKNGLYLDYECAGIYKISIDNNVAYVGKSDNMLRRLAEHKSEIEYPKTHKYKIFAEAKRKGHNVRFEIIYHAKSKWKKAIIKEIGEVEGQYIRALRPPLNYQIPKESDWHKFDINPSAQSVTLDEILNINNNGLLH